MSKYKPQKERKPLAQYDDQTQAELEKAKAKPRFVPNWQRQQEMTGSPQQNQRQPRFEAPGSNQKPRQPDPVNNSMQQVQHQFDQLGQLEHGPQNPVNTTDGGLKQMLNDRNQLYVSQIHFSKFP